MKDRKKKILNIAVSALAIGLVSSLMFPMDLDAIGGGPRKRMVTTWGDVPADQQGKAGVFKQEGYFTQYAPNQYNWYENTKGSNLLFRTAYAGFTWYSPVPPSGKEYKTTLRSPQQTYENANINNYSVAGNRYLYDDTNKNFKTAYCVPNTSLGSITSGGHFINVYAPYKGVIGEWRSYGYSSNGDLVGNPWFPQDTNSDWTAGNYPYDTEPWLRYGDKIMTEWDDPDNTETKYADKLNAVRSLLNQEPTMRSKSNDVHYWANRLSLRTNPTEESGVFIGTRNSGYNYRTLSLKAPVEARRNLRTIEFTVRDAQGNFVASYTRNSTSTYYDSSTPVKTGKKLMRGSSYSVTAKVKSMVTENSVLDPSLFRFGYATGATVNSNNQSYSDNEVNETISVDGIYNGTETKTFAWDFTVPETANKYMRITGVIPDDHYDVSDNMDTADDWANLIFEVTDGNMRAENIKLVDRSGKEVNDPIPGEDYKIRYYVKYYGPSKIQYTYSYYTDAKGISHRYVTGWYYPTYYLPFTAKIYRVVPPVNGYNETQTYTLTTNNVYEPIISNRQYIYETEYRTYEVPIIKTEGTVASVLSSLGADNNPNDNQAMAEWHNKYDIKVQNVNIAPISERPYEPGYQYFAVQYDVVNEAPSFLTYYEKDVNVSVALKDQIVTSLVHIGKGTNAKITQEMKVWIDPSKDKEITATVYANFDKKVWEEDWSTQVNNRGSNKAQILPPPNPYSGACSLGGQHTFNSWVQKYNVHTWTGTAKSYFALGKTNNFNLYKPVSDPNVDVTQNETFKINKVLFRSKLTEDYKLGVNQDGWVDITNGTPGKIKAGYGYELKVEVEYNTNAFSTQPQPFASGVNGKWVRPMNVTENIPKEMFVKTSDGKILSVTGTYGTLVGLEGTVAGSRDKMVYTYSIKSKDTLGIKSVPKIYIDENTKDGIYDLQVFTPEINGIATKTSGTTLCDFKNLKIEVIGSSTDDIKSHVVQ